MMILKITVSKHSVHIFVVKKVWLSVVSLLANKVPFNYAFLLANLCTKLCSMSNIVFSYLVVIHGYSVNVIEISKNGVRNPIRNAYYKEFKACFSDILKACIATAKLNRCVLDGEPRLEKYFNRIFPSTADLPVWCSWIWRWGKRSKDWFYLYNKADQAALKWKEKKIKMSLNTGMFKATKSPSHCT